MTVFLVVGAVGVLLLLVALVVGDVLDGALEGLSAGFFSTEALAGFLGALGFLPLHLRPAARRIVSASSGPSPPGPRECRSRRRCFAASFQRECTSPASSGSSSASPI